MSHSGRAGALPGGTVEEVGVEAVLQSEQHLGRLAAFPAADDVRVRQRPGHVYDVTTGLVTTVVDAKSKK
jgi:hypothetical protein